MSMKCRRRALSSHAAVARRAHADGIGRYPSDQARWRGRSSCAREKSEQIQL
jgi:hypothetical protein